MHTVIIILKENILLAMIIISGLIIRLWGIDFSLPFGVEHSDESFFVIHALKFGTGDLNPHWFLYPTFNMYILFIFYGIYFLCGSIIGLFNSTNDFATLFFTDPSSFYVIGRTFMASLGTTTLFIVYLIGKKLFDKNVGLVSSLFMAFVFYHVNYSHIIKPAVSSTFFISLSFLFAVYILINGKMKYYMLSGIIAGLATASKYPGGVIVVSIVVAHILYSYDKMSVLKVIFNKNLFLAGLFVLVGFFMGCPFAFFDYKTFLSSIFDLSAYATKEVMWLGINSEFNSWLLTFTKYLRKGMGLHLELIGVFSFLFCLIYKHTKKDILLTCFPITYFLLFGGQIHNFTHYWIPVYPFLLIMSARFLTKLVYNSGFIKKRNGVVLAFISTLFIFPSLKTALSYDYLISHKCTSNIAKEWIEKYITPGTKIVVEKQTVKVNKTLRSIKDEYERKMKEVQYDEKKESEKYVGHSREPAGNIGEYYNFLLKIPEQEKSYYVYEAWSAGEKEYSYYVENGFRYIVISLRYRAYRAQPEKYPNVNRFYEELFDKATLVKEFIPNKVNRPGFHIRVYKIF